MKINFKRNIDFILTKISLGLIENKEYKVNLYSAIIVNIVVIFMYLVFFMIFQKNFSAVIDFSKYDFIVYGFLILTGSKIYHIFVLKYFSKKLIRGDLNTFLTKPINPFLFSIFSSFRGPIIVVFPIMIIVTITLIFYGNYSLINIIPASLFFIFSCIYYMVFFNLFESTAFFIKENSFIVDLLYRSNGILGMYPAKFMKNLSEIFYFIPNALVGYFTIEILKSNYNIVFYYLWFFIISLIIFSITTYFIWKIGLVKYEANS